MIDLLEEPTPAEKRRRQYRLIQNVLDGATLEVHSRNFTQDERADLFALAKSKGCVVVEDETISLAHRRWLVCLDQQREYRRSSA